MSLTPTKFAQDASIEYSSGTSITSSNLNSIQKGILYNNSKIDDLERVIDVLKDKINNSKLVFTDIVVESSAWQDSGIYKKYPYSASIKIPGVTSDMIPNVIFSQEMLDELVLASTCESYNGGIHIYAMNQASKDYTIPKIILWKE